MLVLAPASVIVSSAGNLVISTGRAAIIEISSAAIISMIALEPHLNANNHNIVLMDVAEVSTIAHPFVLKSTTRKVIVKTPPPQRSWQARLGSKMDSVLKRTLDNAVSLASYPIDMIRVEVKRDPRTQDLISRTVVANEIMPIYFEKPFTELPMRRMEYSDSEQVILTVDGTELKDIRVKCPLSETLNRDDLLFRIIRDDYSERPVILILQVKEELGTIGYSKLIQIDYVLSYYDEKLPESILEAVVESTTKREEVQW